MLTADCLPVLFCDRAGSVSAAAHAGWRGLAGGVLEATVAAMQVPPGGILAWMGAAIGPQAFEVGDDVRDAFVDAAIREAAAAFVPHARANGSPTSTSSRASACISRRTDDPRRRALHLREAESFYSYRRDGVTGRMASLIWLE